MEHDEERVAELALGGDLKAWEILIARHQHRILVSLLARGIRVDRAKEIVQEVWTRLLQQQRRGQLAELRLPGLALTQATFLAMDDLRREQREKGSADALAVQATEHTDVSSLEERMTNRAKLTRAAAALSKCSPKARQVFQLVYDAPELPHAEVAKRVNLSVQRVRNILCAVRKKLRAAMEERDE